MTDWGSAEFPLCRQCHLPLIICGHCMHFDRSLNNGRGACSNQWVPGRLLMEVGSSPSCRNFRPKLRTRTTWGVQPAAWMVLGVGLVLALGLPLAFLALRASRGAEMQMTVSGPAALGVGERGMAVLDIRDRGSPMQGFVKVALSPAFFRAVGVTGVDPPPAAQNIVDGRVTLSYKAPTRCYPLLVRLEIVGQQAGNHTLDVWATTPTGTKISAQLPISVTAAEAQGAR